MAAAELAASAVSAVLAVTGPLGNDRRKSWSPAPHSCRIVIVAESCDVRAKETAVDCQSHAGRECSIEIGIAACAGTTEPQNQRLTIALSGRDFGVKGASIFAGGAAKLSSRATPLARRSPIYRRI